ncbi:MAG: hypothetical protein KC503_02035, partial [Myxococcales bacterium]|nr:hypothetical protein [Myxococcales bacterium]
WLFLRFTLADDIRRASPLQARLKIWGVASSNWSSDRHALLVLVEDSANAPVTTDPSHSPDKPSGVKTLQELRWPASGGLGWKTDDYNEVDVSALIFALANAYDLRAGAHVQLWIRGDFSTESAEVATLPPSDGSYRSPVLEIDHCAP